MNEIFILIAIGISFLLRQLSFIPKAFGIRVLSGSKKSVNYFDELVKLINENTTDYSPVAVN